jgi:hypothetical protein
MRQTHALSLLLALSTLAMPAALAAQHSGGAAPRVTTAAPQEAAQLAWLVGQWDVTVMPKATSLATKIHGMPKLSGTWKVWRAFDGFGIEDELRIIDASGNPNALSNTMRIFDPAQGRWTQSTLDVYRGRFTTATGTWSDGEFTLRSVGRDAEGTPYVQRTRFHDITPTSFKYQADRSTDGERTWETAVLRIDATRVAASAPR